MASSRSQRQMVTPEICATRPVASTCRRNSARLKRDSGRPNLLGSSHAIAFTRATIRGGKTRGATSARAFLQAGESFSTEAFAPLAHHRPWHIQALANHLVLNALRGEEHNLGPHDVPIR